MVISLTTHVMVFVIDYDICCSNSSLSNQHTSTIWYKLTASIVFLHPLCLVWRIIVLVGNPIFVLVTLKVVCLKLCNKSTSEDPTYIVVSCKRLQREGGFSPRALCMVLLFVILLVFVHGWNHLGSNPSCSTLAVTMAIQLEEWNGLFSQFMSRLPKLTWNLKITQTHLQDHQFWYPY